MKRYLFVFLSLLSFSCTNNFEKKDQKNTIDINKAFTDLNSLNDTISFASADEIVRQIRDLHQSGGIEAIILWSKEYLKAGEVIKFSQDSQNKTKERIGIIAGLGIYKLNEKGKKLNETYYESGTIDPERSAPCFSFRESFLGKDNYNLVIYERLEH